MLDFDDLLQQIPRLIGRLINFDAFAVYLLDERAAELRSAYMVGYPDPDTTIRLKLGQGLVGAAVATEQPLLVSDVSADPRYLGVVPDMVSAVVVPLLHKSRPLGALNILSRHRDQFTERDVAIVRQFAAHVSVALVNARLFERSRRDADAFETLAEIGREVTSLLDLDQLFSRLAQLTKGVVDYRTFGILLLNDIGELEMKLAVQYGEKVTVPRVRLGEGLVGYAALHKEAVLVPDVSQDPRYIKLVPDVRSELAIPMLLKDRCIGVVDLESPELDAFSKRDVEILTLLASQAAVAIENARLYEEVRANEERLEKEVRFAQRVQIALLPAGPPKRLKNVELAAAVCPGARARRGLPRVPDAGVEHAGHRGRGCIRQGRSGGALQRVRRGAGARPHVPPPLHARAIESGRDPVVRQHDPPPASARRVLLHAVLRVVRSQAAHR